MAAHERLGFHASISLHILTDQLAKVLTKGAAFKTFHVSTPPTRTAAIYSAPPGERPDRTFCEKHFLAVSINTGARSPQPDNQGAGETLVYAIEVLIYSTAYSTTFFVSKVDSTGYLRLLNLPRGSPSPLKDISATFLSFLVGRRKRPGIRSIISLFARAQGQYLFPGSSDNNVKHVLDDRGLIKWWSRVLDPLLEARKDARKPSHEFDMSWESVDGFLKVPGLDDHDVKSFLPKWSAASIGSRWTIGHPLRDLSNYRAEVPPRCLVPRFPDDPKSRFLDELDVELTSSHGMNLSGDWRSVKTIEQFWELMSYRQECSAGRLVGFLWIVFQPQLSLQDEVLALSYSQSSFASETSNVLDGDKLPNLQKSQPTSSNSSHVSSSQGVPLSPYRTRELRPAHAEWHDKARDTASRKRIRLSGPVIPRHPRVKIHNRMYGLERPEKTPYYIWPQDGRGQVILEEKEYSRVTELLLHLDFANLDLAQSSTERWISEVRSGAPSNTSHRWGTSVTGTKPFEARSEDGKLGIRTLNVGLVRKKRKAAAEDGSIGA